MAIQRFSAEQAALLVVDVQEKLLPHMHEAQQLEQQVGRLIDGANVLGLPVIVTEQYRKGLGVTVPGLAARLSGAVGNYEKLLFSACVEPVQRVLVERGRRQVIVCGIEAHVCVLQTCLDLAQMGMVTAVAVDAVSSRRTVDRDTALTRMGSAGIVPTTVESILLEMVREAGSMRFKSILPVIK